MARMGEEIMESLQEMLDFAEGKIGLKTSHVKISPVPVCDEISPTEIISTRENLGMSQGMFAIVVGVSLTTVESWESGSYAPDGAARRLITIMQQDPDFPKKYGIVRSV